MDDGSTCAILWPPAVRARPASCFGLRTDRAPGTIRPCLTSSGDTIDTRGNPVHDPDCAPRDHAGVMVKVKPTGGPARHGATMSLSPYLARCHHLRVIPDEFRWRCHHLRV